MPLSRSQAFRIIKRACSRLALPEHISCHSLRKTFGYHAWAAGANPTVLMVIYNHSSFSVTKRYLGIEQEDKDNIFLILIVIRYIKQEQGCNTLYKVLHPYCNYPLLFFFYTIHTPQFLLSALPDASLNVLGRAKLPHVLLCPQTIRKIPPSALPYNPAGYGNTGNSRKRYTEKTARIFSRAEIRS